MNEEKALQVETAITELRGKPLKYINKQQLAAMVIEADDNFRSINERLRVAQGALEEQQRITQENTERAQADAHRWQQKLDDAITSKQFANEAWQKDFKDAAERHKTYRKFSITFLVILTITTGLSMGLVLAI